MLHLRKWLRCCTRRRIIWFVRVNVLSWILQGILVGILTVLGMSAIGAVVSAKVAAWIVFAWQVWVEL